MLQIANKQEFYRLSRALQLGNRLTQWTADEFEDLMITGSKAIPDIVGVRHAGRAFGGGNSFRITRSLAYKYLIQHYVYRDKILFDEALTDSWITLQGEIMADYQGLYLRYSHAQMHQRTLWQSESYWYEQKHKGHTFEHGVFHAFRLQASAILQNYLDADSWEDINRILREYEYPVIEFTTCNRPVGVLDRNTLIWEVRTRE